MLDLRSITVGGVSCWSVDGRLGVFCLCVCVVLSGSCPLRRGAARLSVTDTYVRREREGRRAASALRCAQNKPSVCQRTTASVSPPVRLDLLLRLLQLQGGRLQLVGLQQEGQERGIESAETGRHRDPVRAPGPRPAAALELTDGHRCHPGNTRAGLRLSVASS